LSLLGPAGETLWDEAADQTLGYKVSNGQTHRAKRLASFAQIGDGLVQLVAETDDPASGVISIEIRTLGPRLFRMTIIPDTPQQVTSIEGAFLSETDERFVGFGERFDAVNQRGHQVEMWA